MTLTLFAAFAPLAGLVVTLAALASAPVRHGRALGFGLAVILLGYGYGAGSELLGRPKPVRLAVVERAAASATVIASHSIEGEALYLWLLLPGAEAPRAYALPWSRAAAEALLRAEAEAEASGGTVVLRHPFRSGEGGAEGMFEAIRPPPPPAKAGA